MFNLFSGCLKNFRRIKMLIKAKKKWLGVCVVSLGMAVSQVNATGIPVFDGAASEHNIWEKTIQWVATAKHYAGIIANWKKNFQEMIRGKLGNLQDVTFKANDPYTQEEYLTLLDKLQERCNKISNSKSKRLCMDMIDIDKEKVQLFYSSMKDIDNATAELNAAIQNQRMQSDSGKAQTAENEVQLKLDNVKKLMDRYEFQLKVLDTKQDFMRKARIDIAQEQINGTKPNIVNAISQATTAANLQRKADRFRKQAIELRGYDRDINENKNSNGSKQRADDFLNRKVLQ